jgi:hypothetical protein
MHGCRISHATCVGSMCKVHVIPPKIVQQWCEHMRRSTKQQVMGENQIYMIHKILKRGKIKKKEKKFRVWQNLPIG